jgi:hypothetical protein
MAQNDAAPRCYLQVELQGNMEEICTEADHLENGKVSDFKNIDDDGRMKRQGIVLNKFVLRILNCKCCL